MVVYSYLGIQQQIPDWKLCVWGTVLGDWWLPFRMIGGELTAMLQSPQMPDCKDLFSEVQFCQFRTLWVLSNGQTPGCCELYTRGGLMIWYTAFQLISLFSANISLPLYIIPGIVKTQDIPGFCRERSTPSSVASSPCILQAMASSTMLHQLPFLHYLLSSRNVLKSLFC